MKSRLLKWTWKVIGLIFPPVFAGCGENGLRWCDYCQKNIDLIERNIWFRCGEPCNSERWEICLRCATGVTYFQQLRSYTVYRDPLKSAVQQYKYKRNLGLGEIFARKLADGLSQTNWEIDISVPVSLSKARIQESGYIEAMVLARTLGWKIEKPVRKNLLVRIKETHPQVRLSLAEREQNLKGAFDTRISSHIAGNNMLIVDDVITSDSKMNSCAKALHDTGAEAVHGISIARAI